MAVFASDCYLVRKIFLSDIVYILCDILLCPANSTQFHYHI